MLAGTADSVAGDGPSQIFERLIAGCDVLAFSRRCLIGKGFDGARADLLKLSQGRSTLNVLNKRRFGGMRSVIIPLGDSYIHYTKFEADTVCETFSRRDNDRYVFHIPLRGSTCFARSTWKLSVRPGDVAVVSEPGELSKSWHGTKDALNYVVGRSFVEKIMASEFGRHSRGELEFPLLFSILEAPNVIDLLTNIIVDYAGPSGLTAHPVSARQFGRILTSAVLLHLPHNRSKELDLESTLYMPAYIRKAEVFINAHLTQEIDIEAIAQAVGVSVRTLYYGFRSCLGESPASYISGKRLDLARQRLLESQMNNERIGKLAPIIGYKNASHFSRAYKQRFGETPRETLRD